MSSPQRSGTPVLVNRPKGSPWPEHHHGKLRSGHHKPVETLKPHGELRLVEGHALHVAGPEEDP